MSRSALAAIVLFLATLFVTGCASAPVVDVTDWQLTSDLVAAKSVHLPAHFEHDLPRRDTTYTLRAHAAIPEGMRGQSLTFELPVLHARSTLKVDGEEMMPLDPRMREGYRGIDQQAFHVPARFTERGDLDLELAVSYRDLLGSRLDVVPRLSATEEGTARLRFVRAFNVETAAASAVVVLLTALAYGFVFLQDRSRAAYGWFAIEACGASYTLMQQGVLQHLVGPHETSFVSPLVCIGEYASVQFTHALFKLGKPHAAWTWGMAVGLLVVILVPSPFLAPFWVVFVSNAMTLANVNYQAFQMARVWRRTGLSFQVAAIGFSWVFLAIAGAPDIAMWYGLGEIAGGLRGVSLGLIVIAGMQAIVLIREHHDALVHTRLLNEELRRQLATRADALAEALAHAGREEEAQAALAAGEVFAGRYDVVRCVGEGGMGRVYEVRRRSDGARLALKLMSGRSNTRNMARFAREAQIIAQLDHPNVVRIVDVDITPQGHFFLVVDFIEGLSLVHHRARFVDVAWSVAVLSQVADGLVAIHSRGIVHRDLKPDNVLVAFAGSDGAPPLVKIADFGVSLIDQGSRRPPPLDGAKGDIDPEADTIDRPRSELPGASALTQTGVLVGTPMYMAPELARGAKLAEPSSDIFSFGVLAYEILTGAVPFDAPPILRGAHLKGRAATPFHVPAVPLDGATRDLLAKCLARDPAARPDARTIAEALRRVPARGAQAVS